MMRSDHLTENNEGIGKIKDNVVSVGQKISCTSKNSIAVQKRVFADLEEFNRKIEIRQEVNKILNKRGFNENGVGNDMKEALKTYKLHGKI